MRALLATAVAGFTLALAASAFGQDVVADQIKAAIKKKFPEAPVESVRKVPYGNLYEVVGGGEIYYTDEKASYLFLGHIVDTATKENVTEVRLRQVNAIKFADLPLDQAVKIVRGNGQRKVAIFEDPNCGYCKRFERDLQGVSDITVYVFLYPILAADSKAKSAAVWCSADKGQAWLDIMLKGTVPANDGKCDTPLDKILALGREKRIQGTPTIIFEDGDRVPGAITMDKFEEKLKGQKTASAK